MIIVATEYSCHEENYEQLIGILKEAAILASIHPYDWPSFTIGYTPRDRTKVFLYQEFRSQKHLEKFIRKKKWINVTERISQYISRQDQKHLEKLPVKTGIMTC